jgi:hypothetical protein
MAYFRREIALITCFKEICKNSVMFIIEKRDLFWPVK